MITKAAAALPAGAMADRMSTMFPDLVKGKTVGGDGDAQAVAAERLFRSAVHKGWTDPHAVTKALSPQFQQSLGMAIQNNPQNVAMRQFVEQLQTQLSTELGKNISLASPLASGLVPFDLVAPTRLIYPVYSPYRNLVPRVPGQGLSHRAKVISAVSGALPGQLGVTGNRFSIPELPAGGGLAGNNWPNQLPSSGSQTAYDMNIPYSFFGLTEAVSWLAQFAGQGFEDAAGLASLILLQESMLLEERAMIGSTSVALATPGQPTLAVRSAGTGETGIGITTALFVKVTALNYYGETLASTEASTAALTAGQVVDVTIQPVPGALAYNVYASGTTNTEKLQATVGGHRFTIQGTLAAVTSPPTVDTGTAAATDYEGMLSVVSGHAATGGIYPTGIKGSYVNQSVGDVLNEAVINTALEAMWDGSSGIFADPDDIWGEGSDFTNLANSLAQSSGNTNYRFFISQQESSGIRAGYSVSEYTNPITRKTINLKVHPYLPQGTAQLMSWKLPQPWSNVSNVWENVMVQDYLSISWPVIDVTFRYSLFFYGTMFCAAPQYNGLLQGIQKSATTPYS